MRRVFAGWFALGWTMVRLTGDLSDPTAELDDLHHLAAAAVRAIGSAPSFMARVEARWTRESGRNESTAAGLMAYHRGRLRWDVDLDRVRSPMLPASTLSMVRNFDLAPVVLLLAPSAGSSTVLLGGANACLEESVPRVEARGPVRKAATKESIAGESCLRQTGSVRVGARAMETTVWTAAKLPGGLPLRVRVTSGKRVLTLDFRQPKAVTLTEVQFQVPRGYARYADASELARSLVWGSFGSGSDGRK